ncbi:Qa-SNARE, Sso1/Syntaxin1-type [Dunaliella salina]|uniref:Qa-SNARE, Sso1/Syntaxin1-type n=1 Tax=Dunaliella salina TaxID=3046 RepID=A0ABQ7H0Q4_DUNSA|nr:Qa-SNARE, Sso1/Syntaxin1-type [Dunaliella salina]|eukprot:KAF5840438.1 Qa-SNARE, Sso1/Syntaxin1-type [Dunaliella salina]
MNDLLGEVRPKDSLAGNNPAYEAAPGSDVEMGEVGLSAPAATEKGQAMRAFFSNVESIKNDMAEIRALQREVLAMHEKSKTIVKSKDMERHREDMQDVVNQISMLANKVKHKVEMQDKDNERAKHIKGQDLKSALDSKFFSPQGGAKMGPWGAIFGWQGKHVPEEEVDKMIENGEAETIFQKAIMEQGRGRVLDTLAEIQERHRAIKELEQSLLELHQIFLDMAVLVEAQGEMLDNIEKQVHRSVDYVSTGTNFLSSAKKIQHKTRKLMICCACIILIIVIIIVLAYVKPWELHNNSNNNQQARRLLLLL